MKLAKDQNTVIFSMPGDTGFRQVHQRDLKASDAIRREGGYFIVQPFATAQPLYLHAEVEDRVELADIDITPEPCRDAVEICSEIEYLQLVKEAILHCRAVKGKVVLSRLREIPVEATAWQMWLTGLRKAFPHAFVYLLHTERYGTWMGATPETLVQSRGTRFRTDALAGTKWGGEPFTQKEFEEQEIVTATITGNLHMVDPVISERSEVNYGNLRHLLTQITWESPESIMTFAERLHPTPAVCGVPAREAYEYILRHEPHDRLLYTGFLGKVDPGESAHLFVNLRCMQLFRDRIRIFAGGGINALSDPAVEWEETERKMNALIRAMNINGGNI